MTEQELKTIHKFCKNNRHSLIGAGPEDKCGCFYCLAMFSPIEVKTWIDGGQTAMCPKCGVDSVLVSWKITSELLKEMQKYWF